MASENYSLFDDFEYRGVWWLPENPKQQIPGILRFNKRINLELIGSFHDEDNLDFETPIILGISDSGKIITLLRNTEVSSTRSWPGIVKSIIDSDYLLIGKHFSSPGTINFSAMQANFTNLEAWMSVNPFRRNFSEKTTSYKFPESFEISISPLKSKISSTFEVNSSGRLFTKMEWNHTAFIKITPECDKNIDWYHSFFLNFQNLLTLLIGEPAYIKMLKGFGEKKEIKIGEDIHETRENIEIYYRQSRSNVNEEMHPVLMIMPLPSVIDKIESIIIYKLHNFTICL